jgi:hypothetical protein
VLHLGGVGKYVSQIWGWSVHSWESGDLHTVLWFHHYLQHPGHTHLEETMRATMSWKSMHNLNLVNNEVMQSMPSK